MTATTTDPLDPERHRPCNPTTCSPRYPCSPASTPGLASTWQRNSSRSKVRIQDEEETPVILATLGPGEYFGDMALLDDQPRSATVVTETPCVFLTLSRAPFQALVLQQPGVALSLLTEVSRRLRACHRRVADLALLDAYARTGRFLIDHAVRGDEHQVLPARWTPQAMAVELGIPGATLEQVLRELEREGYLAREGGRMVVLKQLVRPHDLVGLLIW